MDEFIGRRIEDEVVKGKVFRDALVSDFNKSVYLHSRIFNFRIL